MNTNKMPEPPEGYYWHVDTTFYTDAVGLYLRSGNNTKHWGPSRPLAPTVGAVRRGAKRLLKRYYADQAQEARMTNLKKELGL